MVTNIDDNLGKLWRVLQELELEENTLVVFMTDNGPQQRRYTAGFNMRKSSVLEGGIRVPCFFYWKGVLEENRVIDYPSAHIDLMPTLLDMAGIPYNGDLDGISLEPMLRGKQSPPGERPLFFVWTRGYPQKYSNMAVRKGSYKLVGQIEYGVTAKDLKLFDLQEDPSELHDIGSQKPDVHSDLLKELDAWYEEIILSPNLVTPPRLVIGSSAENPVILGRNDWKGPKAKQWGSSDAFGYWDVTIEKTGPYEVKLGFVDQLDPGGQVYVRAGTRQYWKTIRDSAFSEIPITDVTFQKGDAMLEGWYQSRGRMYTPTYIEINRSDN